MCVEITQSPFSVCASCATDLDDFTPYLLHVLISYPRTLPRVYLFLSLLYMETMILLLYSYDPLRHFSYSIRLCYYSKYIQQ